MNACCSAEMQRTYNDLEKSFSGGIAAFLCTFKDLKESCLPSPSTAQCDIPETGH